MTTRQILAVTSLTLGLTLASCSSGSSGGGAAPTGSVSGSVLNAPNPVSGVTITIDGAGGTFTTTTSNAGNFTFENIPTGDYTFDFDGNGVFDSSGNAIPDKVDIQFPSTIGTGNNVVGGKPIFMPEKALGTMIDTSGGLTATIPAGTVISNAAAGISIVFETATDVTFQDADDTTIAITEMPLEQIPVSLPASVSATSIALIQPAGATFDVRPKVVFPNENGLPVGTQDVPLFRFDPNTGTWAQFGIGTVSADGNSVISDAGQGLEGTGWHTPVVATFCTTTVTGRVEDGSSNGIADALVTTANGTTGMTDINGDFSIAGVPVPTDTFQIITNVLPEANTGFLPGDSTPMAAMCGTTTNVGTIVLAASTIDMLAPTIVSTTPDSAGGLVNDNTTFSATFSEVISPGSLNSDTLSLQCGSTTVPGVIGVSVSMGQTTATFVPTALLPLDSTCTFTIGAGILDGAGNALGTDTVLALQTAVTTAGGSSTVDATPDAPAAMDPGTTQQMSASVLDAAGNPVTGPFINWTSDEPSIASVDATGLVTAHMPGTAMITAKFGTATDTVTFTVNTPAIDSVTVTPGSQNLAVGSAFTLSAEALDVGSSPLNGFQFDWTSDAPSVATVDANGTVTAIGAGSANIRATEPGSTFFDEASIQVIDTANVTSVTVTPSTSAFGIGATEQFSAEAFDVGMNSVPGVTMTWTSSNPSVATVNANGLVTGVAVGSATITGTADGSGNVFGTSSVTIFVDTPLSVELRGGNQANDPVAGVRVLRHDSETGAFIEELTTESSGTVNFGMVGAPRTTLTVFLDDLVSDNEAELFTLLDVEVGAITLTVGDADTAAEFDVQVNGVPMGSDIARVFSGGYAEADEFEGFGASPSITVSGVEAAQLQADGNVSFLVSSSDSNSGELTAAAFLLDQDPANLDMVTQMVTVTTGNVVSIPFTSNVPTSPTGGLIRRSGAIFDQYHGNPTPATSGNTKVAIPTGADAFSFIFEVDNGPLNLGRELVFTSQPASINVTMPVLDITNLSYSTGTISWTVSGADVTGLDFASAEMEYSDQSGNDICWGIICDPTRTSVTAPGLPSNLLGLTPPAADISYGLEVGGVDTANGFDAFMTAIRPYMGNPEQFLVGGANEAYFAEREVTPIEFSIGGTGTGTVTIDTGSGPVAVSDGEIVSVNDGQNVTLTATADATFVVSSMNCPYGPGAGVGTSSASCTFSTYDEATIDITFD